MPANPAIHSDLHHLETAMKYIAEDRIHIHESLFTKLSPSNPQIAYQNLLRKRMDHLTVMFDWQR